MSIAIRHERFLENHWQNRSLMLASVLIMILMVTLVWGMALNNLDDTLDMLAKHSVSIKRYKQDPWLLITLGMVGSYVIGVFSIWLLIYKPPLFVSVWLFSLALAEARIPILHEILLLTRYPLMLGLICFGLTALMLQKRTHKLSVQKMGLIVLSMVLAHLMFDRLELSEFLLMPMQLAVFLGIFYGLTFLIKTDEQLHALCKAIAITGILVTIINVLGWRFAEFPILQGRLRSWYMLPTGFANGYVLLLITVLWLFINTTTFSLKILSLPALLIGFVMIVASGTRNAMLVFTLSTIIMCFFWKKRYFFFVVFVGSIFLAAMYFLDIGLSDISRDSARLAKLSDKETRFRVWSLAWSFISEKPFWGYGLSTNLINLSKNMPAWERFDTHNAYLGIWLRMGFIGLLGYVFIYISALKAGFKLMRSRESNINATKSIAVLFFSLLIALLVAGFFEENLSSRGSIQQALWAVCAALLSGMKLERQKLATNNASRFYINQNHVKNKSLAY